MGGYISLKLVDLTMSIRNLRQINLMIMLIMPNFRKILLDLLPMTGTPAAVEVLAEYIRKTKIKPWEAAITLNALTVTAYSDINIAKYLLVGKM